MSQKYVYTKEKRDPQIQWYMTESGKRWRVKFSINKRRKRHYIEQSGYTSFALARKGKMELLIDIENGLNEKGGNQTVDDYWKQYSVSRLDSGKWRFTTYKQTSSIYRIHVLPYWGNVRLDEVNRQDVQLWVNKLSEKGLHKTTIKTIISILKALIEDAVINDYLVKNPVRKLSVNAPEPKDQSMTKDQFNQVVEWIRNNRSITITDRTMLMLTLFGLRRGEIAGLKVGNIGHNSVSIVGQLNVLGEYIRPKTMASIRTVPVSEEMSSLLLKLLNHNKQIFADNDKIMSKDDFIFIKENAQIHTQNHMYYLFLRMSDELGFKVWPHKMRHAFSTFAFSMNGINPKDIMHILGHANMDMSMYYNTGTEEGLSNVVNKFNDEFIHR